MPTMPSLPTIPQWVAAAICILEERHYCMTPGGLVGTQYTIWQPICSQRWKPEAEVVTGPYAGQYDC